MDPLVLVLASPLLGSLALGLVGHRRLAPEINVAFSLATFLSAAALTRPP